MDETEENRMNKDSQFYGKYLETLTMELVPAMGCTEPIAIAYAAAKARETLGQRPEKVVIEVSGNIVKNVKSVIVPHTGGMKGIAAAAVAGIIAGDASRELEVISTVTQAQIVEMKDYLNQTLIEMKCAKSDFIFDIGVHVFAGEHSSFVRVVDTHTNVVLIEKDGIHYFQKR